jgi:hypothetical protein
MINFKLLKQGINTQELLKVLDSKPNLWNQRTLRTRHAGTAHGQVDDIWLRFNPVDGKSFEEIRNGLTCVDYPPYEELAPHARELVTLATEIAAKPTVGRCLITRIKPGCSILPHVDSDMHANYYTRIHLCLAGEEGNMFYCGDESVTMRTGELWWFDNKAPHHCVNLGNQDRIHIVMDVKND